MIEFRVLGPLAVLHNGDLMVLRGPNLARLLAVLLCRANCTLTTVELAEAVWATTHR